MSLPTNNLIKYFDPQHCIIIFEEEPGIALHKEKSLRKQLKLDDQIKTGRSYQTEIRLRLQLSDRFGAKRKSAWFQANRKMANTIGPQSDPTRARKDFLACTLVKQEPCDLPDDCMNIP